MGGVTSNPRLASPHRSPALRTNASWAECVIANQHSQSMEDALLLPFVLAAVSARRRAAGHSRRGGLGGTFVELGAYDGVTWSNTLLLETCFGFHGLLIEGNPQSFRALSRSKRDAKMVHSAVCLGPNEGGPTSRSINLTVAGGGAAGDPTSMPAEMLDTHHRTRSPPVVQVPCAPLRSLMRDAGLPEADFLSLDVEGAEETVLSTVDASVFGVLVVETNFHSPDKNERVRQMLTRAGLVLCRRVSRQHVCRQ